MNENFDFQKAYERQEAIKAEFDKMARSLDEDPTRDSYTEAEKKTQVQLQREYQILEMKIAANMQTINVNKRSNKADINKAIREAIADGKRFGVKISREVAADFGGNTSGYLNPASSTNPAPVTMGEIVEPLYSKTILAAIGSPLMTGLKGNYQWPVVEAFEATINDEGVALGDTKIPVNKLIAKPERIGVAVPITREALNETGDILSTICTQYIPTAAAALMNKIMFSKQKVGSATNLVGPYVNVAAKRKLTYATDAPTLADLLKLKSVVLAANIQPEGLCYVMTETTKSLLEATPKWEGANEAIIDNNGNINGVPVFTTSYAAEGDILFGSFKYAPQALFGEMSLIIDPYTLSRKNAIDFVFNCDYAITVLREEAFSMLSKA